MEGRRPSSIWLVICSLDSGRFLTTSWSFTLCVRFLSLTIRRVLTHSNLFLLDSIETYPSHTVPPSRDLETNGCVAILNGCIYFLETFMLKTDQECDVQLIEPGGFCRHKQNRTLLPLNCCRSHWGHSQLFGFPSRPHGGTASPTSLGVGHGHVVCSSQ